MMMSRLFKINLVYLLISVLFAGCNQKLFNDKCNELIVVDKVEHQQRGVYTCEVEETNIKDTLVFDYHAFDSIDVFFNASLKIIDDKVYLEDNLLEFADSLRLKLDDKEMSMEMFYMDLKHQSGFLIVYLKKDNGLYLIEDEVNYLVFSRNNINVIKLINEIEKIKKVL